MGNEVRFNNAQAVELYLILKDHLSRRPDGETLLKEFESNPEHYSEELSTYLKKVLPEDEMLATQIANALDEETGSHFSNVVTGGNVNQIVNIAKLGILNLNVKKSYYAFQNIKQLSLFLSFALVVGASVYGFFWYFQQPRVMNPGDGYFNIAIAQFGEVTNEGVVASKVATDLSNTLFNFLDSEYNTDVFGIKIDVAHKNIPIIIEKEEAEELAQKINAHIVVYGNVVVRGDSAELLPRFYVASLPDTDELIGQEKLEFPIKFPVSSLGYESEIQSILRTRASILLLFTEALTLLTADHYEAAESSLLAAIKESDKIPTFKGKEILYLILGMTYRLQGKYNLARNSLEKSLEINPDYARVYIGLGNLHYLEFIQDKSDPRKLDLAIEEYERAFSVSSQDLQGFLGSKARVGLGNTYLVKAQLNEQNPALFNKAIEQYKPVYAEYQRSISIAGKGDERLKGLAGISICSMGVAYEGIEDIENAVLSYELCTDLVSDSFLVEMANTRLNSLRND